MRSIQFAGKLGQSFMESKVTPLLVIAALFLGVMALIKTPREEEPQIVVPMMDIFVAYPGATAHEVEERVTKPMERKLWEIDGVEYVYSITRPAWRWRSCATASARTARRASSSSTTS